jgi:hypothetical protein
MTTLFRAYELLASSELFDAEYYVRNNPDIAALNVDPVLHDLESGTGRVLNPSAHFDSAYYLEQCLRNGEVTSNPLLLYRKHEISTTGLLRQRTHAGLLG